MSTFSIDSALVQRYTEKVERCTKAFLIKSKEGITVKVIRIGSGAGYGGDRIEPALDLIEHGNLDYIIFECLAERTIALAQMKKLKDPTKGYNDLFEYRMEKILTLFKKKRVKIITNMGAANPISAVKVAAKMAKELGVSDLKLAAVTGDDVSSLLPNYQENIVMETGKPLKDLDGTLISANAYIGVAGIVEALQNDADIIITGRVADPSLVLGPLVYEFGWSMSDYDKLGKGTIAGHLLECAGQVTGGYFCDPGYKEVENLWNLGYPIAEVSSEGDVIITKLEGTGGVVNEMTCKEQILYEIQDPENYFTPDCIANFKLVETNQLDKDRVKIQGATGKKDNGFYKVSIGYHDCYVGEGQISYGGSTAFERSKLAGEIIKKRLELINCQYDELRIDQMGVNSLYKDSIGHQNGLNVPSEVRLRVVARTKDKYNAELIGNEIEALYVCGPAGGGGAVKSVREIVSVASILIPKEDVHVQVTYEEV